MLIMEEISEVFDQSEKINLIKDGNESVFCSGSAEYNNILEEFSDMIDGAHQMPAFGVSLNSETVKAKKRGVWVEFDFEKEFECNGMPFEKLLIEVKEGYSGFNLIRYNSEYGYDGRCFYLDLVDRDMTEFYRFLSKF